MHRTILVMRGSVLAFASIAAALIACTAAPEIPNDLESNSYPTNSGRKSGSSHSSDTAPEDDATNNDDLPGTPVPPKPKTDAGSVTDSGSGTGTGIDAGPPAPTGPCAGSTTANACFQCCDTNNPGTADEWNNFWNQCACSASKCGNVCFNEWCAGFFPNPGDACDQCLNAQEASCDTQANNSCAGDASCSKLLQCDDTSGCAAKP